MELRFREEITEPGFTERDFATPFRRADLSHSSHKRSHKDTLVLASQKIS